MSAGRSISNCRSVWIEILGEKTFSASAVMVLRYLLFASVVVTLKPSFSQNSERFDKLLAHPDWMNSISVNAIDTAKGERNAFSLIEEEKTLLRDSSFFRSKNSILVSAGLKSYGYSINYERMFRFKSSKIYMSASVGVGVSSLVTIPAYVHVGYGEKWSIEAFMGTTLVMDPDPYPDTEEARNDYLTNPESEYRLGPRPSFPLEPVIALGVGGRWNFHKHWLAKVEWGILLRRNPSYKEFPKWTYSFYTTLPEIGIGYRF